MLIHLFHSFKHLNMKTQKLILLMLFIIACLFSVSTEAEHSNNWPQSCLDKLPIRMTNCQSIELNQRIGEPVKLRCQRTFLIQAGPDHKSENNIAAIYIGMPMPDAAQDNIVIEKIQSSNANSENIILTKDNHTLLVEYFNVKPGFKDKITITFRLDIYRQKTTLNIANEKPYNHKSSEYIDYIVNSNTPLTNELQKHLDIINVAPNKSAITNARKIYNYLGRQLTYGHYSKDESVPQDLLKGGKGHCGVYSNLFVDLCIAAKIPARRCAGFFLKENPEDELTPIVSAHNWAEFYVDGIGWIPVDPIMGDKKDVRKKYYFGSMDNGHLCISKSGLHNELPIWYKTKPDEEIKFTANSNDFRPNLQPDTIQGVHRLQFRWDKPIQISVLQTYGAENMKILSKQGQIKIPVTQKK